VLPPQIVVHSVSATKVRIQLHQEAGSVPATRYRVVAERLTGALQPRCSSMKLTRVGQIRNGTTIFLTGLMEYSIYKLTASGAYSVGGQPVLLDNYTFFSTVSAGNCLTTEVVRSSLVYWRYVYIILYVYLIVT